MSMFVTHFRVGFVRQVAGFALDVHASVALEDRLERLPVALQVEHGRPVARTFDADLNTNVKQIIT